ncbi:GNAT family N-acetyltransferase [Sulfoacidibacillus thermotolerans]|uniref:N-acetyltransferase domain-containing protein n=1 Tax=Sulfoacidibacillus thermotolerans TaxID=1765684 RepID=A0A2U3D7Z3_SULT2|nr:GNAT family N-acetyltransferase [Sulfoacidibacillus thermotolerans]PWI57392.1 hypothetical protein BM613_08680 [Sulfoacidibacillus thermotolerans]
MQQIILRDGRVAELRVAKDDAHDRALIRDLAARVSAESLYFRFMHVVKEVREDLITAMIGDGGPNALGLLCMAGDELIAIGNYVRLGSGETAEVAFLVDDKIQQKGIGTLLLEYLAETAWNHGIVRFEAYVLRDNTPMLSVFRASGYELVSKIESDTVHLYLSLSHTEKFRRLREMREKRATVASLKPFFEPSSIAVVGASKDPTHLGHILLKNILQSDYTGTVYPIHQTASSVSAVRAYKSVLSVPETIDLAMIAVPAAQVSAVVDDCLSAEVRAIIIVASGFSDRGPEGAALEQEIARKIRGAGRRMIGPSSLGVLNLTEAIHMNASFSPILPVGGSLAIASHSGALGIAVLEYANRIGVGVSSFVSLGNRVDVSGNDLLQYWEDDPDSKIIVLYLESFGNPRKFWRITRRIARKKPIIVVKSARTASAFSLSKTRQSTLAAPDAAVDALFRQAGIIRVNTLLELFDAAALLSYAPLPRGRRVAVVTNTAGGAVLTVDTILREGLEFVSPVINLGFEALAESYREVLPQVLRDPSVDAVMVIFTPVSATDQEGVIKAIAEAVQEVRQEYEQLGQTNELKPIVANFLTPGNDFVHYICAGSMRIPVYPFPEHAVRALAKVTIYAEFCRTEPGVLPVFEAIDTDQVRAFIRRNLREELSFLPPEQALQLLSLLGIVTAPAKQPDARTLWLEIKVDALFGPLITLHAFHDFGATSDEVWQIKSVTRIMPLTDLDAREMVEAVLNPWQLQSGSARGLMSMLMRFSVLIEAAPEVAQVTCRRIELSEEKAFAVEFEIGVQAVPAR